jgi:hypothetical protein
MREELTQNNVCTPDDVINCIDLIGSFAIVFSCCISQNKMMMCENAKKAIKEERRVNQIDHQVS